MDDPQSPYATPNLLLLVGKCTVELEFLRGQVALLQQKLRELEPEQAAQGEETVAVTK